MKLTVYDKSNSHPALTYKGKRIITVCRDGSMYLSKILSRELKLHAGNRLGIARDDDRPKDWYMTSTQFIITIYQKYRRQISYVI